MKNALWVIIVIVVGFVSFLIGYSRPHPVQPGAPVASSQAATRQAR